MMSVLVPHLPWDKSKVRTLRDAEVVLTLHGDGFEMSGIAWVI